MVDVYADSVESLIYGSNDSRDVVKVEEQDRGNDGSICSTAFVKPPQN